MRTRSWLCLVALLTSLLVAVPMTAAAAVAPAVSGLRTNGLTDPLAVSREKPRLSWRLDAARRGLLQSRYEIHVASTPAKLTSPDVWDSGTVTSDRSVDVTYGGPELTPYTAYFWSVRVWDELGTASEWSPTATFETGALQPSDWHGDWIGANEATGADWTDYTIDTDVSVTDGGLGVFFRGGNGGAYMWQLSRAQGRLRPHVRFADGKYRVVAEIGLPGIDLGQRHNLKISVAGDLITTHIDGRQVDQRRLGDHNGAGTVGFRVADRERGVVHRLKVVNTAGKVLIDTDFRPGDATFPTGQVRAEGGLDVTFSEAFPNTENVVWYPTNRLPLFRKEVQLNKTVARARLHASAQGVYELRLNGAKVGDHYLAPGWTDYRLRIQSQTYDVTSLLRSGANVIGAEVAKGWFAGRLAHVSGNRYGANTAVSAQLRVTYTDGSTEVFGTDSSWRTAQGATRAADLIDGEAYDARQARAGWDQPGYDASGWGPVVLRPSVTSRLVPQTDQPVRVTQERTATSVPSSTPGTYVYDLGQNMVGVSRITLTGTPGTSVRIRYAEVLRHGKFYTDNLRTARSTDHYTFATSGPETFQARFTFHGFRYIEISGLPSAPPASAVKGIVLGTDAPSTSQFSTDSAMVNQLHSNITWGQRGNFLSIPTDTPARDEKLGWTGDINVFARTAVYNQDSQAFLTKWLRDLRTEQQWNPGNPNLHGAYPSVAPTVPEAIDGGLGNAGWMDAGIHVPWTLWQAYGDTAIIDEHYWSMALYADYLERTDDGFIRHGGMYNDWLNLDAAPGTPAELVGTAFYAKSIRELSQMATATGRTADATRYQQLYESIKAAYIAKFVRADGRVEGDTQTGYILSITNDLVPADRSAALHGRFVDAIQRAGTSLTVGFLGVDGLLPALTKIGRADLAYELLLKTTKPSWGFEVAMGATTIWERWDSMDENGEVGPVGMNSFNHYAYGAVGEWMYRTLAGVSAETPGYRKALIAPVLGTGIGAADLRHGTPYGEIRSHWTRLASGGVRLDVRVPGNTTATVRIPASAPALVTEGGGPLSSADQVRDVVDSGDTVTVTVGSGSYSFVASPVPVAVESGTAQPASGEPGTSTSISALVRNTSSAAISGRLKVDVPDGWATPAPSQEVTIAAGGETRIAVPVVIPLAGNATAMSFRAGFTDARGELAFTNVPFTITQSLTPPNAVDYIDLGVASSEAAHELTPGPNSGTGIEAGRTRRYSGIAVPNSWFEYTLTSRPNQPYLLRFVETYDGPQTKSYDIRVNNTLVHRRTHTRTTPGLETFQLHITTPALQTPTLRLRIQHNPTATGHDPSLADTWLLPTP
ncbi:family 78 glycoside hydrolase catalytic domain [Kribbella sandramycini]|uniref:alpha-L-rhamnosidase n=1 Tax=Kribbella sandramycini TaxID=60450 RepID=A0A841SKL9_9ACTN|nr:alpha-L-rhamnosidase [Kribbella sandramycini]